MRDLIPVIDAPTIQARIEALAEEIDRRYEGKRPVVVCVLKGAFMFFSDLVKRLACAPEIDFVRVASYGRDTSRGQQTLLAKDVDIDLAGRHVIVVEDVVDTGHSLKLLLEEFARRGPASLATCALVDKRERREVEVQVDFPGFKLTKGFIIGYGMDYAERYRDLDAIYELKA
ncbi:MAG: hypoxanthine phosphoribosyltransferase [Desulfovibrionaceae bacterium]|jgi:hypoxanthine phosphoribosyltransferase|nr:hypoxanthine phosphoribosyltransferase [Desulfovibrionaceae bacterium]